MPGPLSDTTEEILQESEEKSEQEDLTKKEQEELNELEEQAESLEGIEDPLDTNDQLDN